MQNNSIFANLTKDDMISEIRLCLFSDIRSEYLNILVEGVDDLKLFRSLLKGQPVRLFESFSGKEGIREIIQEHFPQNARVIGIQDRDYEEIPAENSIYFCDYCNAEMMLISCDEAFSQVYNEYYNGMLMENELREFVLRSLLVISHVRKCNASERWAIRITGFKISDAFVCLTGIMDKVRVFGKLNQMNDDFFTHENHRNSVLSGAEKPHCLRDMLNITNGHDFFELFALICRNNGSPHVSAKNLFESMRCSYRKEDFERTDLFHKLQETGFVH